ncbi:MAG: TIGR04053 family radical SAM/SPASM domain-containing protein [Candidatus Solibacter usitatus]|nr:TIGR04053 family radical SAM/SPASM domain-containing protein [Candidatus Solibacter usitatus]
MGTSHTHDDHPRHVVRDYAKSPMNIYWEMTQACALACRHCRAAAVATPHPMELTFEESVAWLRQIPGFGEPLPQLILTGGDPLARADLYELITEARRLNIAVSITPAATPALTHEVMARLKQHGVDGLGLSLDGSTAHRHDSIRGVPGTFDRTLQAMGWAQELVMPVQVNTLVAAETADDMAAIYELLKPFGIARWSLFFLIAVGRGKVLQPLSPADAEKLMNWIHETSRGASFILATTEAPSFRRVALERMREAGMTGEQIRLSGATRSHGIRDGHGVMFISNTGEICPAGFLPLAAGNVRNSDIVSVYREAPLFRQLHDPTQFEDRCGVCDYRTLCGGSRARAFAASGNPLASDPLCDYEPPSK